MSEPTSSGAIHLEPSAGVALEHGGHLPVVDVEYAMYGPPLGTVPIVLVCHALTGSARVADWWSALVGDGKLLDTSRWTVIGTNALGGCYGTTGPWSPAPDGKPYGSRFPVVSVNDMVHVQRMALKKLRVDRVHTVIGGSLGGMQAIAWGQLYPDVAGAVVAIGATGRLSPMGIGLNAIGRRAIRLDPSFAGGDYPNDDPPLRGLGIARMIGMLSYKSAALLWRRHGRRGNRGLEDPASSLWSRFDVEGYLDHQADKLGRRLDPNTYLALSKAMDLYEVDPRGWRTPALLVGISSDWLYPPDEVRATADDLGPNARYAELASDHGHDGFLADLEQLERLVRPHLELFMRTG